MEVVIATGVMTVGLLGSVAVLGAGLQRLGSSPYDVIAVQKAAEAVESVFAARDSHKITWEQLRNVEGESGNDNGVFLDGAKSLTASGDDGLVNTEDDGAVETMTLTNGQTISLSGFQREITIRDVTGVPAGCGVNGAEPCQLRSVVVEVTYPDGKATRTYTLTTYISSYS